MSVLILLGDVRERLREMPADSIDCVVTSPPYWNLRDYGVDGQIGMEPTLAEHLAVMVEVFEDVRRVLKPTGTLWINYGDCYATQHNARGVLKPKDLCMLPNRLAIALQDAGWWVRSEIVWGKPNAMPDSSGNTRPSVAHEKIFLLTKSGDADVWRARDTGEISFAPDLSERCPLVTDADREGPRWLRLGAYYDAGAVMLGTRGDECSNGYPGSTGDGVRMRTTVGNRRTTRPRGALPPPVTPRHAKGINHTGLSAVETGGARLLRNFEPDLSELVPPDVMAWEIAIAGFSGAHFATFPPALVVPCVLAGCPAGGTVLDPFGGAGTTGMVADRLGRDAVLIELNHRYAAIARDRLRAAMCNVVSEIGEDAAPDAGPLFAEGTA